MSVNLPLHTRRMAGLVNRPGGLTVTEAVTAAEANLATIRVRGLEEIAARLDRMYELGEMLVASPNLALQTELYDTSNFLLGVAGVFGFGGLGEVAFSLCTLLDRLRMSGTWAMASVQIHLHSLRLVYAGNLQGPDVSAILTALRQVVDRVPAPEAAP